VERALAPQLHDRAWALYTSAFDELRTSAVRLDTMPLISRDYFAHRWPTLYSGRRIW
jgi:hypothetical protein